MTDTSTPTLTREIFDRVMREISPGDDCHTLMAAAMWDIPPEQVSPDQRRLAKFQAYALLYTTPTWVIGQLT